MFNAQITETKMEHLPKSSLLMLILIPLCYGQINENPIFDDEVFEDGDFIGMAGFVAGDQTEMPSVTPTPTSTAMYSSTASACPTLSNPQHGSVSTTCSLTGCSAAYSCDKGYSVSGNPTITCSYGGQWDGPPPSCVKIKCDLPFIEDGEFSGGTDYDDVISVSCNPNFNITGGRSARCKEDRKWTLLPTCVKANCGVPQSPKNGNVNNTCSDINCQASYACAAGFKPFPTKVSSCKQNIGWNNSVVCVSSGPKAEETFVKASMATKGYKGPFDDEYADAVRLEIRRELNKTMGDKLHTVIITGVNTTTGEVFYEMVISSVNPQDLARLAVAMSAMTQANSVDILGQTIDINQNTIEGKPVYLNATEGNNATICSLYEEIVGGCPANTECVATDDDASCEAFAAATTQTDNLPLIVGLSVGIAAALLALLLLLCCCYCCGCCCCARPLPVEEEEEPEPIRHIGFLPRLMPIKLNTKGRLPYTFYKDESTIASSSHGSDNSSSESGVNPAYTNNSWDNMFNPIL